MVGRCREIALELGVCCVFLLLLLLAAVPGSRGIVLAHSNAPFVDPPHTEARAPSHADSAKLQTTFAPPPFTLPRAPPPFEFVPPSMHLPPPSVQPPSPSDHDTLEHKWPRVTSPSADSRSNSPDGSGNVDPPFHFRPPKKGVVRAIAPKSASAILPQTPAPPKQLPVNPPRTMPNNSTAAPAPHAVNFYNTPPSAIPRTPPTALAPHAVNYYTPSNNFPVNPPTMQPSTPSTPRAPHTMDFHRHAMPPMSTSYTKHGKTHDIRLAPPPKESRTHLPPAKKSPIQESPPVISPVPRKAEIPPNSTKFPSSSHTRPPLRALSPGPAFASAASTSPQASRTGVAGRAFIPVHPPSYVSGLLSPTTHDSETRRRKHCAPPPYDYGPSTNPPMESPSVSVSSTVPSGANEWTNHHPYISPSGPPQLEPRAPVPPIQTLPPPPPNLDCNMLTCPEPLADPPTGSPCLCVLPIKVGLRLSVALFTFFPVVSDFAQEIASEVNMKQRQVRIMGANVASEQSDKTTVLVDLVPLQEKFDNYTAFLTYESFWKKKVVLKSSLFGNYDVLYVNYPGLPSSPPTAPANVNLDGGPFGNNGNLRTMKPLGVDVPKPKRKANGSFIAVIVLSSFTILLLCAGAAWLLLLKRRDSIDLPRRVPQVLLPLYARSSGNGHMMLGPRHSSGSGSFSSSIATYSGQAKAFKLAEIEKATNGFDDSRILGEGGFGCVYQGTLEDGSRVAVKVLKRHDYQGEREFLAEVEMLSRLHHRNLVKLIGICVEEHARCLIYELIPNGSVESHLHGPDQHTAPLDWTARMRIALGAARGLAYLHEDSSPGVIHRDFKSSNILLEHDFTPKVSDFGLARTAFGEGNRHISTRVMGTFGYVAPEYAMTGHLLVKSDVYSYGVVLLELLTGRKPVDMTRPAGQENLVTWARPLLTKIDDLQEIIDLALGINFPFDSVAKVAAIASMCVQPEVSHRPSMGEVVQALKLVCSECSKCRWSEGRSQELLAQAAASNKKIGLEAERVLLSDMFGTSPLFTADDVGSFHRHSSSGPLMIGTGRKYWQRLRSLRPGSMSDHGTSETHSDGGD